MGEFHAPKPEEHDDERDPKKEQGISRANGLFRHSEVLKHRNPFA
jgi:hypothetical protein